MKMIKVSDEVHGELKSRAVDQTISQVVESLLAGDSKRADLDVVLDQISLVHERLENLERSISDIEIAPVTDEAQVPDWLREKRKREAEQKAREYAIAHPEDSNQESW